MTGVHARLRPRVRHDGRARPVEDVPTAGLARAGFPGGRRSPTTNGCRWRGRGISSSRGCSLINGLCYVAYSVGERGISRAISRPTRDELAHDRPVDPRSPALPASDRRGGEALQRAAEARVPRGHLRAAAADHPDGARDVAVDRTRVFTGWVDLFGGRQSARTIHFIVAWLLVAFVLIHVFEVDHHRPVEQPALDDHRPLPRSDGGASWT